jgi:hypothetical protein
LNITIENNELIYISFFKKMESGIVEDMCISVNCFLFFDTFRNWVGLEIINKNFDGEIELPAIKTIDFPIYDAVINQNDESIEILFNRDAKVRKKMEQDCNIDIFNGQIYGIEIILWERNNIGVKEVVKPFVSRDI